MSKRNFAVSSMLSMLVLYALVTPVFAQSPTGTLRGVVLDPLGALVPKATVTATNVGTNASVTTATSSAGVYAFPGLLVGSYKLTVEAPGFASYARTGVQVLATQVTDVTANLELASSTATVVVETGSNVVQTESSQISGSF